MSETILIFCAHPDDEILGCGGTIAQYAKQGIKSVCVVFSKGEATHLWMQKKYITDIRAQEALAAGKKVGVYETIFLGLRDGQLQKDCNEHVVERIKAIIERYKPTKIFTHDKDDIHPDHKAVYKTVHAAHEQLGTPIEVYTYNVWFFYFRKQRVPRLVVDVSKTFPAKLKALEEFKSQRFVILLLLPFFYFRAFMDGLDTDAKYAEVFYKSR
jgi:LmbE family N-acetylglucosaminyl deacetylase